MEKAWQVDMLLNNACMDINQTCA